VRKNWPDVLCINSYAGSLVIAAKSIGARVVGSYEDKQYGIEIQMANFPKLDYCEFRPEWPEKSLRDTVVIAHPPCSAFSKNNFANNARGVKCMGVAADAFKCTVNVADYALGLGTPALLIESVPDAMKGAWEVHEELAKKYRYTVYRVLQNACCFGTAQWRPRFWVIFTRKRWSTLQFNYQPMIKTVSEVVDPIKPEHVEQGVKDSVDLQFEILRQKGMSARQIKELISNDDYGYLAPMIKRYLKLEQSSYDVHRHYFGGWYENNTIRKLPPNGFTSTLLGGQVWFYLGEPLAINRWKALMGFPPDYIFPGKYEREFRTYLSKGVCPPVAAWLLKNVLDQLAGLDHYPDVACKPGQVLDLNVKRSEVEPCRQKTAIAKPIAVRKAQKRPRRSRQVKPGSPRGVKRYRLTTTADHSAWKSRTTHNAFIVRALYDGPLTFVDLIKELKLLGWKTSSPNPVNIVRWHVQDLKNKFVIIEEVN